MMSRDEIMPEKIPPAQVPGESIRSTALAWLQRLGPLLGLILVCLFFSVLRPKTFATTGNVQTMVLQTAVVITAGLGMTLVIISGGIDISVGAAIALASVVTAALLKQGFSPIIAATGGVASGGLIGLLIGTLVTTLRLPAFIVTLGLWGAVRGLAKQIADKTTIHPDSTWLDQLLLMPSGDQRWMVIAPGLWLTLFLALLVATMLRYTRFGRHVFAIGSNEQTARLCGVHVGRTRIALYAVAGLLTGFAGVLQFSYLSAGDPTTAQGMELDIIAAAVIGGASLSGGAGSVTGTLIGALLMTAIATGCTKMDWDDSVQQEVTGGIIIFVAAIDQLRRRREKAV